MDVHTQRIEFGANLGIQVGRDLLAIHGQRRWNGILNAEEYPDQARLDERPKNFVADERLAFEIDVEPDIKTATHNLIAHREDAFIVFTRAPKTAVVEDKQRLAKILVQPFNLINDRGRMADIARGASRRHFRHQRNVAKATAETASPRRFHVHVTHILHNLDIPGGKGQSRQRHGAGRRKARGDHPGLRITQEAASCFLGPDRQILVQRREQRSGRGFHLVQNHSVTPNATGHDALGVSLRERAA